MNKLGRCANSPWMSVQRVKWQYQLLNSHSHWSLHALPYIAHTHTTHNRHYHLQETHNSSRNQPCLAGLAGPDWLHGQHTHTRTYSAGKRTKASTNMHTKQAVSPKFGHSCGYWRLRSCPFERARVARHLCRRFQSKIVCSKFFHATGTCQTLAYAIVGDQVTFPWQRCKGSHWRRRRDQDSNQWHGFRENITRYVDPCSTSHPKAVWNSSSRT